MEYAHVTDAVIRAYHQALYAHDEEAREAAHRQAEALGMDPEVVDAILDELD